MPRDQRERKLQIAVADYLRAVLLPGTVWWHVPNGGMCKPAFRGILADMGERPGVADLIIVHTPATDGAADRCRGHNCKCVQLCAIELKAAADKLRGKRAGYQSRDQKQFEADLEAAGGVYAVCRSVEEVRAQLHEWRIPTREVG